MYVAVRNFWLLVPKGHFQASLLSVLSLLENKSVAGKYHYPEPAPSVSIVNIEELRNAQDDAWNTRFFVMDKTCAQYSILEYLLVTNLMAL